MSEQELDPFIEQVAAELRRPVRLDARFDERVMAAIEEPAVIPLRPAVPRPWHLRRWTVSISPLGAAVAAVLVAMLATGLWRVLPDDGGTFASQGREAVPLVPVADATGDLEGSAVVHQFLLVDPDAKSVVLTGDFNDWDVDGIPLTRLSDDGVWTVSVRIRPGQYRYQFVVDDTLRVPDPRVPQIEDEFGGINSLLTIGPVSR
ncbi:MAG TPA: glycogen-binding domain-containing protein [Gemmatimonadaceae bacterium]